MIHVIVELTIISFLLRCGLGLIAVSAKVDPSLSQVDSNEQVPAVRFVGHL